MKAVAASLVVLALVCYCAHAGDIWSQIPGGNDDARMANIYRGVLLARLAVRSNICVYDAFTAETLLPSDNNTVVNWAGFLCGFWGGPANTTDLCTYYTNGARSEPDTIVIEDFGLNYGYVHTNTLGQTTTSKAQYETVRNAIAASIAAVTNTPAFALIAINDLDTNLRSFIVNTTAENTACPTATQTIQWGLQTQGIVVSAPIDSYVTWVWNDDEEHGLKSNNFVFEGMGGQTYTLKRNKGCEGYDPLLGAPGCVLSATAPTTFNYTAKLTKPGEVIEFTCPKHPGMTGTLRVGQLTPSPSRSPDPDFDNTGIDDQTSISSEEGSAATFQNWLSLFL